MCGGGGGGKQKESEAERAQAQRAKARLVEWESDGYKQLEQAQIQQGNVDLSNSIAGRSNADLEQASMGSGDVGITRLGSAINAINSAKQTAQMDAKQSALDIQQQHKMNAARVGQDVAAQVDYGLSSAAQRGSMKARNDLQNKIMLSQAKGQMIGSIAQGAAAGYMLNKPPALEKELVTKSKFSQDAQMTDIMMPYNGMVT